MRAIDWRMNRTTYWLNFAAVVAIFVAIVSFTSKPPGILELAMVLLCVPRLHDVGLSGWYVLFGFGIEIAGLVLAFVYLPLDEVMVAAGGIVVVLMALMIWLGCIKGQAEANAWGDPPGRGYHFKRKS